MDQSILHQTLLGNQAINIFNSTHVPLPESPESPMVLNVLNVLPKSLCVTRVLAIIAFAIRSMSTTSSTSLDYVSPLCRSVSHDSSPSLPDGTLAPEDSRPALLPDNILLIPWVLTCLLLSSFHNNRTTFILAQRFRLALSTNR